MKLIWTTAALLDRQHIRQFIAEDNPSAAVNLDLNIKEKAELLIRQPQMGRIGRVAGTRELVIHKNYLLIYFFSQVPEEIFILRVLHASQRWEEN